jgi:hypothetical protein
LRARVNGLLCANARAPLRRAERQQQQRQQSQTEFERIEERTSGSFHESSFVE